MENGIITSNKEKVKVKKPKHYKVVMHNDDFTTMEFVVDVLMTVFNKDVNESNKIMMDVHKIGKGIVGLYQFDIATTKVIKIEIIDSNNTAIYLDVKNESFINTAMDTDEYESKYLVNMPWYSGTTNNVVGKHDGSMISNVNSKFPYRIQGREYSVALQMVASDTVTILKDDSSRDIYVANWGSNHTTDESNIKKNYNLIGSIPAQANTSPEYWIGDIEINTNTGVWFPSCQGSGDSQGFADRVTGDNHCTLSSYVYGGTYIDSSYGGFVSLECSVWTNEMRQTEGSAD